MGCIFVSVSRCDVGAPWTSSKFGTPPLCDSWFIHAFLHTLGLPGCSLGSLGRSRTGRQGSRPSTTDALDKKPSVDEPGGKKDHVATSAMDLPTLPSRSSAFVKPCRTS